jgi:ABC-type sugar transport system ATPase subunit
LRVDDLVVPHPFNTQKNIVNRVSFSVRAGEILGIVGLVGAGRSEIVNAVSGAIKSTEGAVFLKGKPVAIQNPRKAVSLGIVLLSEDRKLNGLVPTMNIMENISLASIDQISDYIFLRKKKEQTLVRRYIESLSVKMRGERDNVMSLSGGNQQKVVVAKWLATKPTVLLLDEPTRGIDVGAKVQIYEIMVELAKSGMAIVMISSELPEMVGMCDRFVVIAEGEKKAELSRTEADEEKLLKIAAGA